MRKTTRKLEPGEKLGKKELLAIGVGGMIGGGIFSVLGLTVLLAGNGAPASFLVGMLVALVAGYFFVRLALFFRDDGGIFTFVRGAWPKRPELSALVGWGLLAMYVGTLARRDRGGGRPRLGQGGRALPGERRPAFDRALGASRHQLGDQLDAVWSQPDDGRDGGGGTLPAIFARRDAKGVPRFGVVAGPSRRLERFP